MNYPRIYERVYTQPLCIHPSRFQGIHSFLLPRLAGKAPLEIHTDSRQNVLTSPVAPGKSEYDGKRRQKAGPLVRYSDWGVPTIIDPRFFYEVKPGVACVPIYGALAKNLSAYEESCGGGTDIAAIAEAIRQATVDSSIRALLLDIDSPGGEVTGIPELAELVHACSLVKPVYAFSDAMCASAADWIASQATEIYGTPSSSWGSIGTYLAWLDETVAMQLEGLKLELFAEGKHKGMGLPGRPLTPEDRTLLQNRVKTINDSFKSAVTSKRPDVTEENMQGQTFSGAESVSRGLVDGLVGSFEELLALI